MYGIEAKGRMIGVCEWEFDPLYTPMAGLYVDNRLECLATADLPKQDADLPGPEHRFWFSLPLSSQHHERLLAGDPAVQVLRTEDAAPIEFRTGRGLVRPNTPHRVEHLLTQVARSTGSLSGFPKFISSPYSHQVQICFLDLLERLPDPSALETYIGHLRAGKNIFDLRKILIASEEFRARTLSISERLGALVVSPFWSHLATFEPWGEARPHVRQLSSSAYNGMSDLDFVVAAHRDCHGDEPTREAASNMELVARNDSRLEVLYRLRSDAASGGRFIDLVD